MSRYDKKEKRTLVVYTSIFLFLAMGFFFGGVLSYKNFEYEFRRQAENQISAIAKLKATELVNWRRERLGDAQAFYHNSVFSELVKHYFENPEDVEMREQIASRLGYYQSYFGYEKICLLDTKGIHRLVIPTTLEQFEQADSYLTHEASASLGSGEITFSDFQRDTSTDGKIYLSILIPLFVEGTDRVPLGVLVLHIDPENYLYPYINEWPIPSDTAETLLVRREGDEVLFLNQTRFGKDLALNLRFPLTKTDSPAVKAVLGQTGIVEGVDYQGHQVLADIRPIPNSPWFLVSKIELDEVYTPLHERLWQTLLIVSMAIFVSGLILVTIWRRQRMLSYRVRAEVAEKLRQSEERFHALYENVSIGLYRTTPDGRILMLNPTGIRMLGFDSFDEIASRNLEKSEFQTEHPRSEFRERIERDGAVVGIESRWIKKDGSSIFVRESAKVFLDENGIPQYYDGSFEDITAHKQAEDALRESRSMFYSLVESMPQNVFSKDLNGRFIFANQRYCSAEGKTLDQILGKTDFDLHPAEFAREYGADDRFVIETGQVVDKVEIHQPLGGERYYVQVVKAPIFDANDKVKGMLGIFWDITERRQAEEALLESESRFRTLFEQAAVGVAQLDTNTGAFIKVNQKYCDILGYTRQEMLRLNFHTVTYPDDLDADLHNMQRLIAGEIREFSMEKRYYRKDGSIVWVSLTVSPLWAVGEQPNHHIAVVEDITLRKQAEQALEKRIIALTLPLENPEGITFTDLFNIEDIQRLQDDFSKATGVASIITHIDGTPITAPSNFCRLCNDIIRKTPKGYLNCCKSDAELGRMHPEGPIVQPCMSGGLWDAGAGISVGGRQVANWLIGQVRDETQTEEQMLEYARLIGADEQVFLEAFKEVPAMSRDRFEQIARALFTLASQLSNMAYQNVQQARFISERKHAEDALRDSEKMFRIAFDNAPTGMSIISAVGFKYLAVNPLLCEMFGYAREEFLGETIKLVTHPDDEVRSNEWIKKKYNDEPCEPEFEKRYIHRDGHIVWGQVRSQWIRNEDGSPRMAINHILDITKRKQAEEALRESEALYRQAIEVANAVPYRQLYHVNGKAVEYEFIGEGIRQITGYGPEEFNEVLWDSLTQERVLLEDLAEYSFAEAIERVRLGGNPVWKCEHRICARDGSIHWVFEAAVELRDPNGESHGSIGLFQDITARKQAEEEIRKLNSELEQRVRDRTLQLENTNKELEAFSYSVSHDLRAPLRGIDGWSQALLEDYQDRLDGQGREYIARVRSETQHMGHLIDDMLHLSRLTRADMVREQVDLSALAHSVVGRLMRDDPHRQVDFMIQAGIIARGDAHLLEAVFVNLLGNAFKFTSKQEQARIEFGETDLQGQRVFFVRDNGAGFDMTYAQKLFGAFQRMHKASEFPGTGVGLAIVQRVIHRHGGRIWFEAEVEHGATFYFTLEEAV